jgi:hypothetical protein
MSDDPAEIFGERVVVIAGGGLAGLSESAAVVGDNAMARLQKRGDLLFPGCAAEWISVDQNYGLAGAVIFIVKTDGS